MFIFEFLFVIYEYEKMKKNYIRNWPESFIDFIYIAKTYFEIPTEVCSNLFDTVFIKVSLLEEEEEETIEIQEEKDLHAKYIYYHLDRTYAIILDNWIQDE